MLNNIMYGIFIGLSFLLTLVAPVLIGKTVIEKSKIVKKVVSKSEKYFQIGRIIEFLRDLLDKKVLFKWGNSEMKKMVELLIIIPLIMSIYYLISYIILGNQEYMRALVLNIMNHAFTFEGILKTVLDNFVTIIKMFGGHDWIIKLVAEGIVSLLYVIIIYKGVEKIGELGKVKEINSKIKYKFSIIKSFNIKNIVIFVCIIIIFLLILSITGKIQSIAFILLMFNIFSIQTTVVAGVVVVTPIVTPKIIKRIYIIIVNRDKNNDDKNNSNRMKAYDIQESRIFKGK